MKALESIYNELHKNKASDGMVFAVTDNNNLVEFHFLSNVIVKLRARRIAIEELQCQLQNSGFSRTNYYGSVIKADEIEPEIIRRFFPVSAGYILKKTEDNLPERIQLLRLIARIGRSVKSGTSLCDMMAEEITKHCPAFSLRRQDLQKRLDEFAEIFSFRIPSLNSQSVPEGISSILEWVFNRPIANESAMESAILNYLFFGSASPRIYSATVCVMNSGEAEAGVARINGSIEAGQFGAVNIYRGADLLGELRVKRFSPAEPAMFSVDARLISSMSSRRMNSSADIEIEVSRKDMSDFHLRMGDSVKLIFAKPAAN
jgi:hypothetical protein